jgi:acetolactate synthase-1/2/3 large subunit
VNHANIDATLTGYMCHICLPVYWSRSRRTSSAWERSYTRLNIAIGANVGVPDRTAISISGDGGILFASNELATAVQYGINMMNIVFKTLPAATRTSISASTNGPHPRTELRIPDDTVEFDRRGLADATVAIDPARVRGALPLSISSLRAASPVCAPANSSTLSIATVRTTCTT